MATNYATTLADRPFHVDKSIGPVPSWFQEKPPDHPVSPAAVVYPGTLNAAERAEVQKYLIDPTDITLGTLTLRAAIAKANEYKTYFASPVIKAYLAAKMMAREKQWKWFNADAVVDNQPSQPMTADNTGAGDTPPADVVPPGHDVP